MATMLDYCGQPGLGIYLGSCSYRAMVPVATVITLDSVLPPLDCFVTDSTWVPGGLGPGFDEMSPVKISIQKAPLVKILVRLTPEGYVITKFFHTLTDGHLHLHFESSRSTVQNNAIPYSQSDQAIFLDNVRRGSRSDHVSEIEYTQGYYQIRQCKIKT